MTTTHHIPSILTLLTLTILGLLMSSCRTAEYAYISDAERDSAQSILTRYSSIIMPGDELDIEIASLSPESLYQFYERANLSRDDKKALVLRQTYRVEANGEVLLPLIGTVRAAGRSLDSMGHFIHQRLLEGDYMKDLTITVRRTNFRVTVTGEVKKPSVLHIEGNRLTIFEALAMTGDITVNGQRQNIMVMREINGQQTIGTIDITSRSIFDSPYYYLQQNDIVYVEPNDKKKRIATRDPNITQYISLAASLLRATSSIFLNINHSGNYK
ncbi:MAG: polysaccharide biosynthesis/export family protein [Bacteroidales bacterium]|nr:polysaccharide biosynthesis/export family protein [Bacteroidales bacterium]